MTGFPAVRSRGPIPADFKASTITRQEFVADVRRAAALGTGYAAGKLGTSEKHWMYYPIWMDEHTDHRQRFAFEAATRHHCRSSGIFPLTPDVFTRFAMFYAHHVQQLDCVGIIRNHVPFENAVLWQYDLPGKLIPFTDQEPDRSVPDDPDRCYLQAFAGKRLLLLCPFASLLRQRAVRETFEGVWSRTGKRWFEPASVEAIDFPYGFVPATHARYKSVLELFDEIVTEMDRREFDVALIAAAALGIPLASAAKARGKIALSLGGHLQALFGVLGKRWRDDPQWSERYVNEWWIDMPEQYRPAESSVCDAGSYW